VEKFNNDLLISWPYEKDKDTLTILSGNTIKPFPGAQFETIENIQDLGGELAVCSNNQISFFDGSYAPLSRISAYSFAKPQPRKVLYDEEGTLWIADHKSTLVEKIADDSYRKYKPNGPSNNSAYRMESMDGKVWVTVGGVNASWNNLYIYAEVHVFENNQWDSYRSYKYGDVLNMAIDPRNTNHFYCSSWGHGVVEFKNGQIVKAYNKDSKDEHTLETAIEGANYYRVSDVELDENLNLWAANTAATNILSVMKNNGEWQGIPLGKQHGHQWTGDIIVTKHGHKWVVLTRGGGLLAYDEGEGFEDDDDDQSRKFGLKDDLGKIITNDIYSIEEDKEGYIWVGTNEGVYVYYNPRNVFDGDNFYASTILIPRNDGTNLADKLLENETVTCIEVDGANQKWFGTQSAGAFLFSPDGTKQLAHFNTSNSPLLSNYIKDIVVEGKTGEVFFATLNGIVSYKGEAAEESEQNNESYVYPNPVRHGYEGPITITGLFSDSNVKITDISGNIVYETQTKGSQAIWYGKDLKGQRVSTGVYLIFCTNDDGTKTKMMKVLFIN
jgi:hypothetical protein